MPEGVAVGAKRTIAGAAAWQLSAESNALMLQAFNIATERADEAPTGERASARHFL